MIELVLFVCLQAAPAECRQESMPFDGPLMACAMNGQVVAVEWLQSHPKWRLTKWRCGRPEIDA
jgi:hypothetical protein